MSENRRQILQMLGEGKINADEAERLISATEQGSATTTFSQPDSGGETKGRTKYLRVQVDSQDLSSKDGGGSEGPTKVNVRIPMQLLRAGVKLAGLVPALALNRANDAMKQKGIPFDLTQLKPENLEELVEQLNDLSVDVDQKDEATKVKVRVFCE
jgi:hypothetical protein